jgi:integrase
MRALAALLLALVLLAGLQGDALAVDGPERTTMSRKPTGQVYESGGRWVARITHPDGARPRYELGKVGEMSEARAVEMAAAMSERVRKGEHVHQGKAARTRAASSPASVTVESFGKSWESGALYELHGEVNRLKPGQLAASIRSKLKTYVYPVLGPMPVAAITEQDVDRVMAKIPREKSSNTRSSVYGVVRRLFDLAIMPGRLRKESPVTRYQRPPRAPQKLFPYLFPDELLSVLRCQEIPVGRRVLYTLAVYLGFRRSSLWALRWSGVDFEHGAILSKVSKTGLAQYLQLQPTLLEMLRRWYEYSGKPAPDGRIVRGTKIGLSHLPEALRADLRAAGVTRAGLFDHGGAVNHVRFHDLRATYATWAKRAGWTEGQITDYTGHLAPTTLERYLRAARTLADLRIEPFPPLEEAIPELRPFQKASEKARPLKSPWIQDRGVLSS